MGKPSLISKFSTIALGVAVGFAAAIAILSWGTAKAAEFYGAFTAAIVAAVAVILGAYYQAELTRQRDKEIRLEEQAASALDLLYWLEHAIAELNFIVQLLVEVGEDFRAGKLDDKELPIEQFREMVSANFMNELLVRAKETTRLPPSIAQPVTKILYRTFTTADRVYHLRGGVEPFRPGQEKIDRYEEPNRSTRRGTINHQEVSER